MSCERYEDDVVEAALGTPTTVAFEAHLEACASCRARLEEERGLLSTVDGVLRTTLGVDPSPSFEAGVRARTAARASRAYAPGWRWAVIAAAAALLVLALRQPRPEPQQVVKGIPVPAGRPREGATPSPTRSGFPPDKTAHDALPHAGPVSRAPRVARRLEPEILIAPDAGAALRRYREALETQTIYLSSLALHAKATMLEAPPREFKPLAVGNLDDLPRVVTRGSLAKAETQLPTTRDKSLKGGGV